MHCTVFRREACQPNVPHPQHHPRSNQRLVIQCFYCPFLDQQSRSSSLLNKQPTWIATGVSSILPSRTSPMAKICGTFVCSHSLTLNLPVRGLASTPAASSPRPGNPPSFLHSHRSTWATTHVDAQYQKTNIQMDTHIHTDTLSHRRTHKQKCTHKRQEED